LISKKFIRFKIVLVVTKNLNQNVVNEKMFDVFNLTDMNYAAVEYDLFIWFE
jgi:hypothetical protein